MNTTENQRKLLKLREQAKSVDEDGHCWSSRSELCKLEIHALLFI